MGHIENWSSIIRITHTTKRRKKLPKMNVSFAVFIAMIIVSATMVESAPQGMAGIGGCPCSGYKTVTTNGKYVGECMTTDQSGSYYCYVHKSCRNCEGVTGMFPQYCKNYSNCRYFSQVHPFGSENSDEGKAAK